MLRVARVLMDYVEPRGLGMVVGGDAGFILERAPDTVRGPTWRLYTGGSCAP